MNLTQVLVFILQLMTMSKVSDLSGETQTSQNIQQEMKTEYFYLEEN